MIASGVAARARFGALMAALFLCVAWAESSPAREPSKPKSSNPEARALIDKAWAAVDDKLTTATADRAIAHLEKGPGQGPRKPGTPG